MLVIKLLFESFVKLQLVVKNKQTLEWIEAYLLGRPIVQL